MNETTETTRPAPQSARPAQQQAQTEEPKPNFFDKDGDLNFYVQNISNGDVILSDLAIKVPVLGVADLRESKDIDVLKKSPSLRQALSDRVGWLKRIDQDLYMDLLEIQQRRLDRIANQKEEVIKNKQNEAVADEKGEVKNTQLAITPRTMANVEKLRLFYNKKISTYTPEDFLMFVKSTKLTDDERGYILATAKEKDIQEAVLSQNK